MEDKVDRIESRQKTSLDRLRDIAYDALETKRKIEDIYYMTKWGIDEAKFIAEGLKKGDPKKFLGALLEDGLSIPLNPAEYIPDIPEAQEMKKNIDWDLSMEKRVLSSTNCLLSRSRTALLRTGLFQRNPKIFEKEYERALIYEAAIEKSLRAKEIAMTKIYKKEAERLQKELRLLERSKQKRGLTVGEVLHIEQAIDHKRKELFELNQSIDQQLANGLILSEEDASLLAIYKANRDIYLLSKELEVEKKKIWAAYKNLVKF